MTPFASGTTSLLVIVLTATPLPLVRCFVGGKHTSAFVAGRFNTAKISSSIPLFGTRQRYDLGLGKNMPVGNAATERTIRSSPGKHSQRRQHSIREATKYWMAPESLVEFPSPIDKEELHSKEQEKACTEATYHPNEKKDKSKKRAKTLPPAARSSQDVVLIVEDLNGTYSMCRSNHDQGVSQQLDPNTIWVEMMIHNQQKEQQLQQQP